MRDEPRNEGCSRERQRVPDNRQTVGVAWRDSSVGTAGRQNRRGTLDNASEVASPRPLSSHRSLIDPHIPWDFEKKSSAARQKGILDFSLAIFWFGDDEVVPSKPTECPTGDSVWRK